MATKTVAPAGPKLHSFPPKSILLPLDLSDPSQGAAGLARRLAVRWGSRVDIVHVDESVAALRESYEGKLPKEFIQAFYHDLNAQLKDAERDIPGSSARLLDGDPFEVLPRMAHGEAADLVILGTHGRQGAVRLAFGSLAESVVHAARVPVLTTRLRTGPDWPRRILVPMNSSDYAEDALRVARDWALGLGATLTALHVFENRSIAPGERLIESRIRELLGERGPDFECYWREGRPYEEIVRVAQVGRFDMIVLAAHMREVWQEAVLGTTAERVLRFSKVPVLAVPAGYKEEP